MRHSVDGDTAGESPSHLRAIFWGTVSELLSHAPFSSSEILNKELEGKLKQLKIMGIYSSNPNDFGLATIVIAISAGSLSHPDIRGLILSRSPFRLQWDYGNGVKRLPRQEIDEKTLLAEILELLDSDFRNVFTEGTKKFNMDEWLCKVKDELSKSLNNERVKIKFECDAHDVPNEILFLQIEMLLKIQGGLKWGLHRLEKTSQFIQVEVYPINRSLEPFPPNGPLYLSCGEAHDFVERLDENTIAFTNRGGRKANEDGVGLNFIDKEYLLADGIGGGDEGQQFAEIALKMALRNLGIPRELLIKSISERFCDQRLDRVRLPGGTTLSSIRILKSYASEKGKLVDLEITYWGDSPIFIFDPGFKKVLTFSPHSFTELERKKLGSRAVKEYVDQNTSGKIQGRMDESLYAQVFDLIYPSKIITRGLYAEQIRLDPEGNLRDERWKPRSIRHTVPAESVAVLISDGMKIVSPYEMASIFKRHGLQEGARLLYEFALNRQQKAKEKKPIEMTLKRWPDGAQTTLNETIGPDNISGIFVKV